MLGLALQARGEIVRKGCPAEGQISVPARAAGDADFVQLHRGRCYGSCPDYIVTIRASGQVMWKGNAFVETQGEAASTIPTTAAKELVDSFRTREFWSLCDAYTQFITDSPTYETRVNIGGKVKQISDYAESAPEFLRKLDRQIDALANTHRWRHGDAALEIFGKGMEECYLPKERVTPLMCSYREGVEAVQKRVRAKENLNAKDSSGWTALMYAAYGGSDEIFNTLLDAGADAKAYSAMRQTVLMAVASGYTPTLNKIERLARAGANINAADSQGRTALMFAAEHYWIADQVAWLIANGARTGMKDSKKRSVFEYLDASYAQRKNSEAVAYKRVRKILLAAKR